jgi:integrase
VEEDEDRARPFPRLTDEGETVETMELVVRLVHPAHRLMFELLAATGVRRSELLALRGCDLALDGGRPFVKVRQRVRRQRGKGLVIGALKSRYAKRDLPVPVEVADRLKALRVPSAALVFSAPTGTPLDPDNMAERVLGPACEEAGVEWAAFHTFRHTVASRLFEEGRNVVQVQRWLGHHSPSFTLDTYMHLLGDELGAPLGLRSSVVVGQSGRVRVADGEDEAEQEALRPNARQRRAQEDRPPTVGAPVARVRRQESAEAVA